MMFKRVMVAVAGIPFLFLVLCVLPPLATAILLAVMCAMAAWELMCAVQAWPDKRRAVTLCAGLVPLWLYLDQTLTLFLLLLILFTMFLAAILAYERQAPVPFTHLTAAVFAGIILPLMLSCLLRLRQLPGGQALVFTPLCICFGSDSLALFAGMLFGKRKLAPRVSPKKTVEGGVGGLLGGVAGMAVLKSALALLARLSWYQGPSLGWRTVILLGLLGGLAGELGDLSFSVIKREFDVKDYGKLLPGHGGVLDRFDSVAFVAPLVWTLLSVFYSVR